MLVALNCVAGLIPLRFPKDSAGYCLEIRILLTGKLLIVNCSYMHNETLNQNLHLKPLTIIRSFLSYAHNLCIKKLADAISAGEDNGEENQQQCHLEISCSSNDRSH